jgi:hypothetical protein
LERGRRQHPAGGHRGARHLPAFDIDAETALRDAAELAHGLAERGILQVGNQPFDTGSATT